jgi:hypothetical protein
MFAETEVSADEINIRRQLSPALRNEIDDAVHRALMDIATQLTDELSRAKHCEFTGEQAYRWAIDAVIDAIRRAGIKGSSAK